MKHRRPRNPWRGLALGAALLVGQTGCPGGSDPMMMPTPIPEPTGTFTATSSTGEDTSFLRPLDTVPSLDGATFYFTAYNPTAGQEGMGVFKVPSAGGSVTKLFSGGPLTSPLGIALSSDGTTLYIADSAAGHDPSNQDAASAGSIGRIYKMPTDGGAPQVVTGTEGYRPRGLELSRQGTDDLLYFTGQDPQSGTPGVYRVSTTAGGGTVAVASGAPFGDPSGVAIASNGDIYVADSSTGDKSLSQIIKVSGGAATVLVSGIQAGFPAGIALTRSETLALVSGRNADSNSDQVYRVNLATKEFTTLNNGVAGNTDAGGLHRARNADIFSWADLTAGDRGKVYRIEFK